MIKVFAASVAFIAGAQGHVFESSVVSFFYEDSNRVSMEEFASISSEVKNGLPKDCVSAKNVSLSIVSYDPSDAYFNTISQTITSRPPGLTFSYVSNNGDLSKSEQILEAKICGRALLNNGKSFDIPPLLTGIHPQKATEFESKVSNLGFVSSYIAPPGAVVFAYFPPATSSIVSEADFLRLASKYHSTYSLNSSSSLRSLSLDCSVSSSCMSRLWLKDPSQSLRPQANFLFHLGQSGFSASISPPQVSADASSLLILEDSLLHRARRALKAFSPSASVKISGLGFHRTLSVSARVASPKRRPECGKCSAAAVVFLPRGIYVDPDEALIDARQFNRPSTPSPHKVDIEAPTQRAPVTFSTILTAPLTQDDSDVPSVHATYSNVKFEQTIHMRYAVPNGGVDGSSGLIPVDVLPPHIYHNCTCCLTGDGQSCPWGLLRVDDWTVSEPSVVLKGDYTIRQGLLTFGTSGAATDAITLQMPVGNEKDLDWLWSATIAVLVISTILVLGTLIARIRSFNCFFSLNKIKTFTTSCLYDPPVVKNPHSTKVQIDGINKAPVYSINKKK